MPNLNKVFLIGHLTRDPETKAVGETSVTNFGIATNHKWKSKSGEQKEDVYFGECQCWGTRGEAIARFVKKGDALSVQGRLRLENWDDKNGVKQSRTRIEVEDFQFLGGKPSGEPEQKPAARTTNAPSRRPAVAAAMDPDPEIPF
jgi:single-strand DNA-binding protein